MSNCSFMIMPLFYVIAGESAANAEIPPPGGSEASLQLSHFKAWRDQGLFNLSEQSVHPLSHPLTLPTLSQERQEADANTQVVGVSRERLPGDSLHKPSPSRTCIPLSSTSRAETLLIPHSVRQDAPSPPHPKEQSTQGQPRSQMPGLLGR